jgi:hypothetical protein
MMPPKTLWILFQISSDSLDLSGVRKALSFPGGFSFSGPNLFPEDLIHVLLA